MQQERQWRIKVGANKGCLLQERANNAVPLSSERDPIVMGHQHLGLFKHRNNFQTVFHA